MAGSVDMVVAPPANMLKKIESTGRHSVLSIPAVLYGGICCLKNTEPGSTDDFVQGLRYIMNR